MRCARSSSTTRSLRAWPLRCVTEARSSSGWSGTAPRTTRLPTASTRSGSPRWTAIRDSITLTVYYGATPDVGLDRHRAVAVGPHAGRRRVRRAGAGRRRVHGRDHQRPVFPSWGCAGRRHAPARRGRRSARWRPRRPTSPSSRRSCLLAGARGRPRKRESRSSICAPPRTRSGRADRRTWSRASPSPRSRSPSSGGCS